MLDIICTRDAGTCYVSIVAILEDLKIEDLIGRILIGEVVHQWFICCLKLTCTDVSHHRLIATEAIPCFRNPPSAKTGIRYHFQHQAKVPLFTCLIKVSGLLFCQILTKFCSFV